MPGENIRDPRFAALQSELRKLTDLLTPSVTDTSVHPIDKSSTFTDTPIYCQGAALVQITTDGDQSTISYRPDKKNRQLRADEAPHIIGPVTTLLITNEVAETNRTIRIIRHRCSPLLVSAIIHGTPSSMTLTGGAKKFYAEKVEYASGTDNFFEADQPLGTLPTLSMIGAPVVSDILIHTIKWQLTPTNAVTYQLYLLEDAQAVDERSESDVIFDSGAAQASGTLYTQVAGGSPAKLPVQANLATKGQIYYLVDWSAAPGDTTGYIKVYGEAYVP